MEPSMAFYATPPRGFKSRYGVRMKECRVGVERKQGSNLRNKVDFVPFLAGISFQSPKFELCLNCSSRQHHLTLELVLKHVWKAQFSRLGMRAACSPSFSLASSLHVMSFHSQAHQMPLLPHRRGGLAAEVSSNCMARSNPFMREVIPLRLSISALRRGGCFTIS